MTTPSEEEPQAPQDRPLTPDEIEDSVAFAAGGLAAAGHTVDPDSPVWSDMRQMLRGDITAEEAIERAARRAADPHGY